MNVGKLLMCITVDGDKSLAVISIIIAFATLVISFLVSAFQNRKHYEQSFRDCINSLYAKETIEQITAAILLRSFYKRSWHDWLNRKYAKEVTNIIVALLRQPIPLILQKTLADSLSYAEELNGQDFQYINIQNVSIKPESAIDYATKQLPQYKNKRLSMHCSDFFHAVMLGSNINYLDAQEAIFYSALMIGTSFHNCIFKNANFGCANLTNAKFDADCQLDGANFYGAIGLDSVRIKDADGQDLVFLDHLDLNGVFHDIVPNQKYRYTPSAYKIFVSKLGVMDSQQSLRYDRILSIIKNLSNIELEIIERKDYTPSAQLSDISTRMEKCDGCIIFAFEYLHVNKGYIHENVVGNDHIAIENQWFVSPWQHIEAAIANGKNMPCLIIYDCDMCRDGMFEDNIVSADDTLMALPYSDSLSKNELIPWMQNVFEYHSHQQKK